MLALVPYSTKQQQFFDTLNRADFPMREVTLYEYFEIDTFSDFLFFSFSGFVSPLLNCCFWRGKEERRAIEASILQIK